MGIENVYMMEPVGLVMKAGKAAALLKIFYKLPPSSHSKSNKKLEIFLTVWCVWVVAFRSCVRKYQLSAEFPQQSNGGVILFKKKIKLPWPSKD